MDEYPLAYLVRLGNEGEMVGKLFNANGYDQVLICYQDEDGNYRNAEKATLQDFLEWLETRRAENV